MCVLFFHTHHVGVLGYRWMLGAFKDLKPHNWCLTADYLQYMRQEEQNWLPDADYYNRLISRLVDSIFVPSCLLRPANLCGPTVLADKSLSCIQDVGQHFVLSNNVFYLRTCSFFVVADRALWLVGLINIMAELTDDVIIKLNLCIKNVTGWSFFKISKLS